MAEDQDPDISPPLQASASSSPSRDRIRLVPAPRKRAAWKRKEDSAMKPNVVVDEMFPEGAGPYMDIDEVFIPYLGTPLGCLNLSIPV